MRLSYFFAVVAMVAALNSQSEAQLLFQIGQQAVGTNPPAGQNPNVFPFSGGENPLKAIDGDIATKYLNFGEINTGFLVTPLDGVATIATGIDFVTGNDSAERDPGSYSLYGSNTVVLTTTPTGGTIFNLGDFTQISSGTLALPGDPATDDFRRTASSISFANTTPYITYLLVFPTVKDSSANAMQIAEAMITGESGAISVPGSVIGGGQLIPEPATAGMLGIGVMLLLRRRRSQR